MKLFASGVAATLVGWGALYLVPSGPAGEYSILDKFIVHEIAFVFAFAAMVMIISRTSWTLRAVGLFLTSVGTSILYCLSSYLSYGATIDPGRREAWLDLARVSLGIGGCLVFIGLVVYMSGFIAYRDDILAGRREWQPGDPDRRSGIERRKQSV